MSPQTTTTTFIVQAVCEDTNSGEDLKLIPVVELASSFERFFQFAFRSTYKKIKIRIPKSEFRNKKLALSYTLGMVLKNEPKQISNIDNLKKRL